VILPLKTRADGFSTIMQSYFSRIIVRKGSAV